MNISLKKKLLVVTLTLMLGVGCSTTWVSTLDSILAAAAPALVNILDIVAIANGQPLNESLAAQINGDAAKVKSLASDFANASASAAPGVCTQLNAAIQVYSGDQAQVLSLAHVSDGKTQTKILLLTNLVTGTVAAITAVIPACNTAGTVKLAKLSATPPLSLSNFIDDYNAVLTAPTGNVAVDKATKKLILHKHSKPVRVLTFGYLN